MSSTSPDREQRIRERAYHLWEAAGRPDGRQDEFWQEARTLEDEAARESRAADEASAESFPASDPPAFSGITGPGHAS